MRRLALTAVGWIVGCVASLAATPTLAQAPGAPIEENATDDAYAAILEEAQRLVDEKRLPLDAEKVRELLVHPTPVAVKPPPAKKEKLAPPELARLARAALLRVGWIYRDDPQDDWQLDLAGGYAIAPGGVAVTCRHVIDPDYATPIKEGYLIAADARGTVTGVAAVLAVDEEMDAAIVRIEGLKNEPLPLNDQSTVGDGAYVYSDPMGVPGYFSEGMVNRFYWFDPAAGKDPTTLAGARNLRIHVSCDWAPGSSGSPVLDECGNALAHVTEIESLLDDPSFDEDEMKEERTDPKREGPEPATDDETAGKAESDADEETDPYADAPATMMVLHSATPARGVRLLAEKCDAEAARGR